MDEKLTMRSTMAAEDVDPDQNIIAESVELLDQKERNDLADEESLKTPAAAQRPSSLRLWIVINVVSTITIV